MIWVPPPRPRRNPQCSGFQETAGQDAQWIFPNRWCHPRCPHFLTESPKPWCYTLLLIILSFTLFSKRLVERFEPWTTEWKTQLLKHSYLTWVFWCFISKTIWTLKTTLYCCGMNQTSATMCNRHVSICSWCSGNFILCLVRDVKDV